VIKILNLIKVGFILQKVIQKYTVLTNIDIYIFLVPGLCILTMESILSSKITHLRLLYVIKIAKIRSNY